jgi:hypothetical protein
MEAPQRAGFNENRRVFVSEELGIQRCDSTGLCMARGQIVTLVRI